MGLKISFRIENDVCIADYLPPAHLCGWQDLVHGGIIFSLLDDVMGNLLLLRGEPAFTARCDIRYRAPLSVGVKVRLEGRELSRKGRLVRTSGKVIRQDTKIVVAEAEAVFMHQKHTPEPALSSNES